MKGFIEKVAHKAGVKALLAQLMVELIVLLHFYELNYEPKWLHSDYELFTMSDPLIMRLIARQAQVW